MTTTMTDTNTATCNEITAGMKMSFDAINTPGCWVNNTTGHLIRLSSDFDANTWTNWMTCEGTDTWWWTFISNDPNWSTDECRQAATGWGINCSF